MHGRSGGAAAVARRDAGRCACRRGWPRGVLSVAMAQSLPREAEGEAIAEREVILVVTYVVVVISIVVRGLTIEPPPQRHLLPQVLQHLPAGLRALAAGRGTLLHVLVSGELLARRRAGVARPDARFARHVGERALT